MGCDINNKVVTIYKSNFNPRTHVGCDRASAFGSNVGVYFNPRTHVGCDADEKEVRKTAEISIHAPTWGATNRLIANTLKKRFQSTHPRGVRHKLILNGTPLSKFQSTHPRGVRLDKRLNGHHLTDISIHAPTWGATSISRARQRSR